MRRLAFVHHRRAQARVHLQVLAHLQIRESGVLRRRLLLVEILKLPVAFVQLPEVVHGHRAEENAVLRGAAWLLLRVGLRLHRNRGIGRRRPYLVFVVVVLVN